MIQKTVRTEHIHLQFIESGIIIGYKKETKTYNISSVDNYKVINRATFLHELKNILNNLKINTLHRKYNIFILIDYTYTNLDKKDLTTIFRLLKFNKIELLNISNILDLSPNELALDISINNLKIYHESSVYYTPIYFHKHQEIIYLYLKELIKLYKIETIKIFGTNEKTNDLTEYISSEFKIKTYIFANPSQIPIKFLT